MMLWAGNNMDKSIVKHTGLFKTIQEHIDKLSDPIECTHGNNPSIPDNELMSVAIEGDDIVIHLPIDLLVWSQAQREESITVIDKQKMAEHIVKHILEFGGDTEIGSTAFEDLIDNYFMNALESAEDWLKGWWEDETNED